MSSTQPSNSEAARRSRLAGLLDIVCSVDVILGRGSMTVGACLALRPQSVVRLTWSAGEHLLIAVNGVSVARGDVVIVHDRAGVRVTDILPLPGGADA